jgi:galactokinase
MLPLQQLTGPDGVLGVHVRSMLSDADPSAYRTLLERLRVELSVADSRPVFLASAPGRTELGGNHTDHNHGNVLAASVQLDSIAAVAPREDLIVNLLSEGFPPVMVNLSELGPQPEEEGTTAALVRGMAGVMAREGRVIGGFDAAVSSRVLSGSGLSSSASIEVLVGAILDHGWNNDTTGPTEIAKAGQAAENEYFGKPCGLMDQVACATGGAVFIDFHDNANPVIERIDADFRSMGLTLLVVDTGGGHADLTEDYASIPREMRAVAEALGQPTLAHASRADLITNLPGVRQRVGDRPVARALHFYAETERARTLAIALTNRDRAAYIALMHQSGKSSGMFLQNCAPAAAADQAVVVALALTEDFFTSAGLAAGVDAACRVHGGGFAGTIQVILPADAAAGYTAFIEPLLGDGCVTELQIRPVGAIAW